MHRAAVEGQEDIARRLGKTGACQLVLGYACIVGEVKSQPALQELQIHPELGRCLYLRYQVRATSGPAVAGTHELSTDHLWCPEVGVGCIGAGIFADLCPRCTNLTKGEYVVLGQQFSEDKTAGDRGIKV